MKNPNHKESKWRQLGTLAVRSSKAPSNGTSGNPAVSANQSVRHVDTVQGVLLRFVQLTNSVNHPPLQHRDGAAEAGRCPAIIQAASREAFPRPSWRSRRRGSLFIDDEGDTDGERHRTAGWSCRAGNRVLVLYQTDLTL